MHDFDLNKKTAIITGGAQGFGLDIAKRFINSGCKVRIWDIDETELKKASNEINSDKLNYDVVDVSNFTQVKNTAGKIAENSNIDILLIVQELLVQQLRCLILAVEDLLTRFR